MYEHTHAHMHVNFFHLLIKPQKCVFMYQNKNINEHTHADTHTQCLKVITLWVLQIEPPNTLQGNAVEFSTLFHIISSKINCTPANFWPNANRKKISLLRSSNETNWKIENLCSCFTLKNEHKCSYVIEITILIHNISLDFDARGVLQKAVDGFSELWFMFLLTSEYLWPCEIA